MATINRQFWRNVGDSSTPQEIKRLRRQMMDLCRRMGQPVLFRHMWNRDDVVAGLAKQCPACYVPGYDQPKNDCPVCFGVGIVSVENDPGNHYIDDHGEIVNTDPGTGVIAPRYGGFDEPALNWMIEPDVAVDLFRITDQGVLVRTFDAQGVAPWTPDLGDNDLCVNVQLGPSDYTIVDSFDRFQLKTVQQVTIRGFGRRGRAAAGGQPFLCQQTFRMTKLPPENALYAVPLVTP